MLNRSVILWLLLPLCSVASAQTSRLPADHEVFDFLRSSTAKVREHIPRVEFSNVQKHQADQLLDDITANTEKLSDTARGRRSTPIPEEYVKSLRLDGELLMSVAAKTLSSDTAPQKVVNALEEVAQDLIAKVTFSQRLMGAGLRLVEFVVHTKKNGVELGDYEVWYVPRGWSDTPDKFRTSDLPSSPAIMRLAPGNYLVWLRKGEMVSNKIIYALGKDGSRKVIVFPIP